MTQPRPPATGRDPWGDADFVDPNESAEAREEREAQEAADQASREQKVEDEAKAAEAARVNRANRNDAVLKLWSVLVMRAQEEIDRSMLWVEFEDLDGIPSLDKNKSSLPRGTLEAIEAAIEIAKKVAAGLTSAKELLIRAEKLK